MPGYVILAAAGAGDHRPADPRSPAWLATMFAVVVVIAAVPDLPRAVAPLWPVAPWPGWNAVSGLVAMDDSAVAVLPAGPYRIIDGRPTYDPAVKILPAPGATGDLVVSGTRVGGRGHHRRDGGGDAARRTRRRGGDRANGVAWVLVESSPGELGDSALVLDRLGFAYSDAHLALHRVPGAIAPVDHADRTPTWIALAARGDGSGRSGQRPRPRFRRDRTRRARLTARRGIPASPAPRASPLDGDVGKHLHHRPGRGSPTSERLRPLLRLRAEEGAQLRVGDDGPHALHEPGRSVGQQAGDLVDDGTCNPADER